MNSRPVILTVGILGRSRDLYPPPFITGGKRKPYTVFGGVDGICPGQCGLGPGNALGLEDWVSWATGRGTTF